MKQFRVTLKSLTPYMQHRMDDMKLADWEKKRGPIMEREEVNHEDLARAEYHAYRGTDGRCFIPAEHIRGALINAGSYIKAKVGGKSKSMKIIVAACLIVTPDEITLPDYDQIDKRSAVNKNVKARVITIRPKWSTWEVSLTLNCYEDTITKETIQQLFEYAGSYVGIGSYRPTANGMFGRFQCTSCELIREPVSEAA